METRVAIRWDNADRGELCVKEEGLTTVFSARCEDPGRLFRLSVYGGGKEGYLGVMQPERGLLTLQKRLTRTAMAGFPDMIEYAGEAGGRPAQSAPPEPAKEAAPPAAKTEENTDLLWYRLGDGSLYTVYRRQPYRAVPFCPGGVSRENFVEKRIIEGIAYAVYALPAEPGQE